MIRMQSSNISDLVARTALWPIEAKNKKKTTTKKEPKEYVWDEKNARLLNMRQII